MPSPDNAVGVTFEECHADAFHGDICTGPDGDAKVRQNSFFTFIYNAAGVPIAAGLLYPAFGVLLSPIIASATMALSSVSVVGDALRLNRVGL